MPTWFLLAILATLFFGIGEVLIKKGFEYITPLWSNILYNTLILLRIPLILFLAGFNLETPSLLFLLIIFIAGLCYKLHAYAVSKGSVSLVSPLVATYPIVTVILSFFFLNEKLSLWQFFGISLVITSSVALSLPNKKTFGKDIKYSWAYWGIGAAFLEGFGDFLSKLSINQVGSYSYLFFMTLMLQSVSITNFLIDKGGRKLKKMPLRNFFFSIMGNLFFVVASVFFFLAFDYGNVSLISPIASAYPGITVLLAILFLKEKVNLRQVMAIGGVILGICLIGY